MKRHWLITAVWVASIISISISLQSCATNKINLRNTLETTETIQVQAYWDPIADASLSLPDHSPKHAALFKNLSPAHVSQEYDVDAFKAFFPKGSVPVGHVWKLDMNEVLPFLRQFHPGATGEMHINPGVEGAIKIFGRRITLIKVGIAQNAHDQSDIVWETAITENAAKDLLETSFYKFSEIERLPIEEAVAQAQAENRPIHVVLTWGMFDDESC